MLVLSLLWRKCKVCYRLFEHYSGVTSFINAIVLIGAVHLMQRWWAVASSSCILSLAKATCLNSNLLAVVAFLSPSWGCERSLFDSLLPAFSIYLLGPYTPRSWPNRGTVLGYPIMGLCTPRLWPSTGAVLEPPTHSFKINYYDNQNPYQTYSKYV